MTLDIDYLVEVGWRTPMPPDYPTLGDSTEGALHDDLVSGKKYACKFDLNIDGDAHAISIYCCAVTDPVYVWLFIYEDDAGAPGDLVALSGIHSVSDNDPAWRTFWISAELVAGTYWLGVFVNVAPGQDPRELRVYYTAGDANQSCRHAQAGFPGYPSDPFGVPDAYEARSYSIFAVFEEAEWAEGGKAYLFDPNGDLTGDVMSVEAMHGRDFGAGVGRWSPGELRTLLRNDDGKYSPNNAGSPLSGYLKTNRPITLSAGLRESSLAAKFVAADTRHLRHADDATLSVGDIFWDTVVWIKITTPADVQCIFSKSTGVGDWEYYLLTSGSRFRFFARNLADDGNTNIIASTFGDIPANTWCMVHVYHDPTANVIGIGVNAGAHDTNPIVGVRDAACDFCVGQLNAGAYLDGAVGPLAIWKPLTVNLTADQLTWLYNGGYGRDFTELGVAGTDGQYLIFAAESDTVNLPILKQWSQLDETTGTREADYGADLEESGGAVGSEAGLDTKIYRGLWSGVVDEILPSAPAGFHSATIKGAGSLSALAAAKMPGLEPAERLTGAWIWEVLYALSIVAVFLDDGQTTTGAFYPEADATALEVIRLLEDCEPGLLRECCSSRLDSRRSITAKQVAVGFADRHHRHFDGRSLVSQAAFSDGGAGLSAMGVEQLDPLSNIYNQVTVSVAATALEGGLDVLWSLADEDNSAGMGVGTPVILAPGQSRLFQAKYPTAAHGGEAAAYVDPWTTPAIGTDVISAYGGYFNGWIAIENVTKSANRMSFILRNIHPNYSVIVATVQTRGVPWTRAPETIIVAGDTDSIATYGLRAYPYPPKWLANAEDGQNFCDYIISRYKDPHNRLRLTFAASRSDAAMYQALAGCVGDRITLDLDGKSGLGINEDCYIESIHHAIDMGKTRHIVTYELASCSGEGAYAVLANPAVGWAGSPLGYDLAHPAYPTSRLEY